MDVVANSLLSQLQLIVDNLTDLDGKLDRLRDELRGELVRVNRRMLTLAARIPPPKRRR